MRRVRCSVRTVRAGLMAGVCLGAVTAHATDGVWQLFPVDGNWNNGLNWTSSPTVPNGKAQFNLGSSVTSITFSAPTTVQTIEFDNPSPAFSFALTSTTNTLTVGGTGIDLLLLPTAPTFTQSLRGQLIFTGSESASTNPGAIQRAATAPTSRTPTARSRPSRTTAPPASPTSKTTTIRSSAGKRDSKTAARRATPRSSTPTSGPRPSTTTAPPALRSSSTTTSGPPPSRTSARGARPAFSTLILAQRFSTIRAAVDRSQCLPAAPC